MLVHGEHASHIEGCRCNAAVLCWRAYNSTATEERFIFSSSLAAGRHAGLWDNRCLLHRADANIHDRGALTRASCTAPACAACAGLTIKGARGPCGAEKSRSVRPQDTIRWMWRLPAV